jgi:hypothetical protein
LKKEYEAWKCVLSTITCFESFENYEYNKRSILDLSSRLWMCRNCSQVLDHPMHQFWFQFVLCGFSQLHQEHSKGSQVANQEDPKCSFKMIEIQLLWNCKEQSILPTEKQSTTFETFFCPFDVPVFRLDIFDDVGNHSRREKQAEFLIEIVDHEKVLPEVHTLIVRMCSLQTACTVDLPRFWFFLIEAAWKWEFDSNWKWFSILTNDSCRRTRKSRSLKSIDPSKNSLCKFSSDGLILFSKKSIHWKQSDDFMCTPAALKSVVDE